MQKQKIKYKRMGKPAKKNDDKPKPQMFNVRLDEEMIIKLKYIAWEKRCTQARLAKKMFQKIIDEYEQEKKETIDIEAAKHILNPNK